MMNSVLQSGVAADVGMDPARLQHASDLAAGWVARGDTPSLVVLVARRGQVVLHEAFGVCHPDDTTPTLLRDSIFPVASLSKPIAAAAIMCLVEDGLIGLNRAFIDYIPELDRPEVEGLADATVADLLRHTAGIDDIVFTDYILANRRWEGDVPPPAPGQHPHLNRIVHLAAGAPLTHPPGSVHLYSSLGYMLLGDIVRRASGQPFWQFVRSRLFDPLGMRDSHYVLPAEMRVRRVYRAAGFPVTQSRSPWFPGIDTPEYDAMDWAGSGAASTASDLAVFCQMLLNGGCYGGRRILSQASVAAMTRAPNATGIRMTFPGINAATGKRADVPLSLGGYGFGLVIFGDGDRFRLNCSLAAPSTIGHVGAGGTCVWADPERELVGVYLSVGRQLIRGTLIDSNVDLFQNAVHAAVVD